MRLSAGEKLGPYELLSPIGEGGMGVVWKARDSRLDRVVAIKVSKEQFTKSFEGEARAIATLNHPHVCQLYDVGPNYLVMEHVEGTCLRGPMPLDKAIEYAAQVLDALDAAHRNRITHRDLKPANILVTKKGIKLLDFGLAKRAAIPDDSEATLIAGQSKNGEIAGTLQYMSPEQLQGKHADARSDIFSFGCVFYEMLTGKQAFSGGSAASVIAAIMEREPQPLESAPGMQRILERCLAKDPEDRWQTARDLKAELVWSAQFKEAVSSTRRREIRIEWPWIAALILGMALAVIATRIYLTPAGAEVLRLSVNPPPNSFFTRMSTTVPVPQFALSPDGSTIVFAAGEKSQLWVRSLAEVNPRPLAGTENAVLPFWSPDGGWIGFFADDKVKKIPARGGVVQAIAEVSFSFAPHGAMTARFFSRREKVFPGLRPRAARFRVSRNRMSPLGSLRTAGRTSCPAGVIFCSWPEGRRIMPVFTLAPSMAGQRSS